MTGEAGLRGLSAWRWVRDYRAHQLRRMASVEFYLASEMTAETIDEFGADHVVVATGAHWRRDGVGSSRFHPLPIPGCVTPADIMAGTQTSGPILIYDDDNFYMGGVLALHLRAQGHEVHLITPLPEISAWTIHTLKQPRIVRKLTVEAVSWDVNLTLHAVEHDSARFVCSYTGEVKKDVPFRSFVMVGARLPDTALHDSLTATDNVTLIGDCLVPGTIHAAVFSGHNAARMINGDERAGAGFRREEAKLMTDDD